MIQTIQAVKEIVARYDRLEVATRKAGTSVTQYLILAHLIEGPEYQTELASRIGRTPSGLTRAMNALVEDGYVKRSEPPNDRRRISTELTDLGQRKYAELTEALSRADL